ncbi:patatin-like phospholipase family protein [Andreprevotia chitinilytica]|uniref:patatin-like phospholipase family protein n=1 Tax=Andreprevotia chitinilytica TaxID=396808 RepID=UPI0005531776|nr:patatin-like phospholipase family protein [Andreprevotia chitinilytica]
MSDLQLLAGPAALARIQREGFHQGLFSHVGAAAGGPKWLVQSRLDRALFGEWLAANPPQLTAIGSSIGAWRLACLAQNDPLAALCRFEDRYLEQRYPSKPTPAQVSAESRLIMTALLGETGAAEVIAHPWLHLNIYVARALRGIDASGSARDRLALSRAVLANLRGRHKLGRYFERVVFHAGHPAALQRDGFTTHSVPLNAANLPEVLMASGTIPGVLETVTTLDGAGSGVYLDGGLIDYHMDLPLADPAGLLLLPHFSTRVTTGWLDKFAPWRRAQHLDHAVIIAPSAEWIARLPNGRIPDRKDFARYDGRDDARIAAWKKALAEGDRLADGFRDAAVQGRLEGLVKPLNF